MLFSSDVLVMESLLYSYVLKNDSVVPERVSEVCGLFLIVEETETGRVWSSVEFRVDVRKQNCCDILQKSLVGCSFTKKTKIIQFNYY